MATKYWISTSSTSFNTAANWSDNVAPANGDTLIFNYLGTASVLTNLSTVLTTVTIIKEKSYVGSIGSISGATWTYLVLDGGTLYYEQTTGQGSASGSPLCMINFGGTAAVANVYDSASQSSTIYFPPLLLKGTSLTVHQSGGSLGVAPEPGSTSTLTAMRIIKGQGAIPPKLYLGQGVTTTALTAETGTITSRSDQTQTAATIDGDAVYDWLGTGAHTTLTVGEGGKVRHRGTGTITTLNVVGEFDRTAETRALTVTNTNIYEGAKILLDNGVSASVTRTNAPVFVQCAIQDVTISMPLGERF
jgi:hypothetical protein